MPARGTGPMGTRVVDAGDIATLAERRCRLVLQQGPHAGKEFELSGPRTVLGKGAEADIVLRDVTVSRAHFEIRDEGGTYVLADLGSTNGTFLDGTRVREAFLHPGMLVRAGEVVLRFLVDHREIEVTPSDEEGFNALVGRSGRMRSLFALLKRIAPTEATILLQGETGTGKGATARAIHAASSRADDPYVVFDSAAVAPNLVESQLFGHEKGAFTGAHRRRAGALEAAEGGTLFLDEIDDLPLDLQPKLLRALEEHEFQRVGSNTTLRMNVRIIAASKADLRMSVAEGRFREDLYFRLSVVTIALPSLRERIEDLDLLADKFLLARGLAFKDLPRSTRKQLQAHHWPGNVRELRNVVERLAYMEVEQAIDAPLTAASEQNKPGAGLQLQVDLGLPFKDAKEQMVERFEVEYLRALMDRAGGNVSKAAREAKLDRKYLYNLLRKHHMGG